LKLGPAGSLQKSKRILSTSSQNEVLPSYKKKGTRIVSSDDDNGDDEFRFYSTQKSQNIGSNNKSETQIIISTLKSTEQSKSNSPVNLIIDKTNDLPAELTTEELFRLGDMNFLKRCLYLTRLNNI